MNLRFPGQYYDAKTGRYIQNDPIGLAGEINTYGYIGENPLLYINVFGLSYWDCVLNKSKKAYDRSHEFGTKTETVLGTAAGGAIGMVVGGGLSGAGCTMVLPVVGTVSCGASGAAIGGAAGAIVGGTMGPAAISGFNGIAGGLAGIVSCSSSDDGAEKDCEELKKNDVAKLNIIV